MPSDKLLAIRGAIDFILDDLKIMEEYEKLTNINPITQAMFAVDYAARLKKRVDDYKGGAEQLNKDMCYFADHMVNFSPILQELLHLDRREEKITEDSDILELLRRPHG